MAQGYSGASATKVAVRAMRLILSGLFLTQVSSFYTSPNTFLSRRHYRIKATGYFMESSDDSSPVIVTAAETDIFLEGAEIVEVCLEVHRPLGCTVEESLAKGYEKVVFCSKVKEDGFAAQAGMAPGDVFIGVTGMFGGGLEDVTRAGIDRVKSLVAACPDDEPLNVRLARGTSALEDHEAAVVDLCSRPDKSDTEVEECVTDFLQAGYFAQDEDDNETEEAAVSSGDDSMLDDMFSMWAEDLPATPAKPAVDSDKDIKPTKPKPWSSRSSPSGTFVRDPKTGKMRNIDA